MGLQVLVYALFLRSDWHSLFSATGKGLVSRELGEAMASFDSPLIPKLGWLVFLGRHIRPRGRNSPFGCLGLLALHGMLSAAGTFLSPGGDHCMVSSPLRG